MSPYISRATSEGYVNQKKMVQPEREEKLSKLSKTSFHHKSKWPKKVVAEVKLFRPQLRLITSSQNLENLILFQRR